MYDFGKITFTQEHEDGQKITHEIRGDASLDEVVDAFEYFLKGAGYHLSEGQHIGFEYDEDSLPRYEDNVVDLSKNITSLEEIILKTDD